jgi:anaerobic magnesium-protoporphyrin IX monomethyl ester cyclase
MKILLINPSITKGEVYAKYAAGAPCLPPLGLCYLAAALLEKGYETKIIDCVAENTSVSQLKKEVESFVPDIVGVTSTTISYVAAKKILHTIKQMYPEITTILGGAHISALPLPTMLECKNADIGVFGEGEYTLLEIVERLDKKQSLFDVKGTLLRNNGHIIKNKPRGTSRNLDKFPFPARHLLKDLRLYSHTPFRGAKFMTTMITTRGCPFNCGYCDQSVFGRIWRYHSSEYVVAEMTFLKEKYNIDFISIEDDNFLLSRKRTIDICQKMIKNSLNISWSCLGRANEVDDNVLPLLKKAGCKTIYIGIESGSSRILELVNKKISIEDTKNGINLIKKHGINVTGSFIFGLPTETKKDIEKTIDLALSLPLDGVSFFIFTPYPNTPLRDLALKHGKVSEEWKNYSGHPSTLPFIPNNMDEKYLLEIQSQAYKRFLLRPSYLIKHVGTFTNRKALRNGFKFIKSLFVK